MIHKNIAFSAVLNSLTETHLDVRTVLIKPRPVGLADCLHVGTCVWLVTAGLHVPPGEVLLFCVL